MYSMNGRVAVITGGGGNIGGACAKELAKHGAIIALCDRNFDAAQKNANEIIASGGKAKAYENDVTDFENVCKTVGEIVHDHGKIDFLVCSAGGSSREKCKRFIEQDMQVITDNIRLNLFGCINFNHACAKIMAKNGFGRIVNIASIVALRGTYNCAEYGAAKGGIISLSKTLAMELGEHNITVNCVSPGLVRRPDQMNIDFSGTNFLGRNCTAEDIANAVSYCLSDAAGFMTGANLVIDGGRSLGLKGSC